MSPNQDVVETHVLHKSSLQEHQSRTLVNQYELLVDLGEGMHGKVVLGRNSTTGEDVAIKVMRRVDPNNRRLPTSNGPAPMSAQQKTESKIRREIAVMKKCSHQNLVQLLEVIDDPKSRKVYLIMENLAGGEVLWRNKDGPPAPVLGLGQVQRIMRDVTLGLEYLHHQGIIHRDIKPANLLWTAERQSVKICDFGVSHFTIAAAQEDPTLYDEAGLTKTAGSPAFFAPEICYVPDDPISSTTRRGSQSSASPASPTPPQLLPITKQIDIWALGVTLYCLLFGTPPWQGSTQWLMFRSICKDDFEIPDTMAVERIPTGGREHRPEGKDIGWCVVDLLHGLLEKDQNKRIKLSDIKRIPWIQNGVRDPERWLRETAPEAQAPVTVTDEDTQGAIKRMWFSYHQPNWVTSLTDKLKRVPIPGFASSRSGSRGVVDTASTMGPSNAIAGPSSVTTSLGRAGSSRTRAVMGRLTFGSAAPSRMNPVPGGARRNSGSHSQSRSDPSNQLQHHTSSVVRSNSEGTTSSACRTSDSLRLPSSAGGSRMCISGTSSPSSPGPSATPPDEPPTTATGLRSRFRRVVGRARDAVRSGRPGDEPTPRGRTSYETFNGVRTRDSLEGLKQTMRASSWGYGAQPTPRTDDDDGQASALTSSEAGGGMQDFNKSVVRLGAGGYVDRPPAASSGDAYRSLSTPGASGSGTAAVGMTHHSDSSSNSTATATTHPPPPPPLYIDVARHPPRVRSPLARTHRSFEDSSEDNDEDALSSDVFDEHSDDDGDDPESSEEEVLELRTRRPSTVLTRSGNTSPLR